MAIKSWFDRVAYQQPSRARAAAALLVISTFVPGQHPTPVAQAKEFGRPESFIQAQVGRPLIINGTALGASEIRRKPQANVVVHQRVATNFPVSRLLDPTPPSYNAATDAFRTSQARVFSQPESFARPRPSASLILNGSAAISADIFSGFDTFGWPPEPQIWAPTQGVSLPVVLTTYTSPSIDVRRAMQAKIFGHPESFGQGQRSAPLILNGSAAYVFASDVQRWPQSKVFSQQDVFAQPQQGGPLLTGGTIAGWNAIPLAQARWFGSNEEFQQPQRSAPVVLNVPSAYNATIELRRPPAKWFADAETFVAPWSGARISIQPIQASDGPRGTQARVFGRPEVFAIAQRGAPLILNETIPIIPPEALVIVAAVDNFGIAPAVDNFGITINVDVQFTIVSTGS